jgi:hypothetical protein
VLGVAFPKSAILIEIGGGGGSKGGDEGGLGKTAEFDVVGDVEELATGEVECVGEGACDDEAVEIVQLDLSRGAVCVNREATVLVLHLGASFGSG